MALVERFWQPDTSGYKQVVDACFVHPTVVSTKFGEAKDRKYDPVETEEIWGKG